MESFMGRKETYDDLIKEIGEVEIMSQIGSLLSWDQEVMMPENGGALRAEQLAWITKAIHEKITEPKMGDMLDLLESEDGYNEIQEANIRLIREQYDKATKKPSWFVEELARHNSKSLKSWQKARAEDDFSIFRDDLEKMIDFNRKLADFLGWENNRYDALLDIYETGLTVEQVDPLFAGLRESLVPLVKNVIEKGKQKGDAWIDENVFPIKSQENISHYVAEALGFNFDAGRRDKSTHPFCGGPNPDDVRWTTRYDVNEPFGSLYGSMHEVGHALYEQGRPRELDLQPAGHAVSLGIHESQSRLWENQIGRSLEFCEWVLPLWKKEFPHMSETTVEQFWRAVNRTEPSLIRVEADEATYNLHIMIRYEIEKKLINGELEVDDLPNAWNDAYETYLGIKSPNNTLGVLQDVHWSMGAFGYFPTYTLGNLYAAQLLEAARKDITDLDDQVRQGEFTSLLDWMRKHIHSKGSILKPEDLILEVTGNIPSPEPFVNYLRSKLETLYAI